MAADADVRVVVPTRGRSDLIREAIESIAADGSATSEVVVVENGSAELSREDLRRLHPRAELVQVGAIGRAAARNLGARDASAPYVVFLDSDDVSLPGRLARQVDALEEAPHAILCFGRVEGMREDGSPDPARDRMENARVDALLERGLDYESILVDCPIYTSAIMVRREPFLELGGYDPAMDGFEDLELYLRVAARHGLLALDSPPVARHRVHPGNTSVVQFFACMHRLAELHLREHARSPEARRLLLERDLDALWALDDFRAVRALARSALRERPGLIKSPIFRKRLLASALPAPLLHALRSVRT